MYLIEEVQSIAKRHGIDVNREKAEAVLWQNTAFPASDSEHTVKQLDQFFARAAEIGLDAAQQESEQAMLRAFDAGKTKTPPQPKP